jgi:AcrR family transcriptional regulator
MTDLGTRTLRDTILDAARNLFASRGYAGTAISDIAQASGTSKAGVYYHFQTKTQMLEALLDSSLDGLAVLAAQASSCDVPAKELLARYVDLLAGSGPVLISLCADPSVLRELEHRDVRGNCEALIRVLAGRQPTVAGTIRARAAFAIVQTTPQYVEDGQLSEEARTELLAASLRALG